MSVCSLASYVDAAFAVRLVSMCAIKLTSTCSVMRNLFHYYFVETLRYGAIC